MVTVRSIRTWTPSEDVGAGWFPSSRWEQGDMSLNTFPNEADFDVNDSNCERSASFISMVLSSWRDTESAIWSDSEYLSEYSKTKVRRQING